MKKLTRITAVILLFFNGVSAGFGGLGLIIDPSGKTMQLPFDFLEHTPFNDFLIPGIILFTVNGLFNFFAGILGIMKKKIFAFLTLLCGIGLTGWITVQIILIKSFYAPLHLPYFIIGLTLIILAYFLRKQVKAFQV